MSARNSAAARAADLRAGARRGVWRRVLAWLGVTVHTRRADALAARCEAGAAGERFTAQLLEPLTREGWHILPDRGLLRGRANVDFLLVPPCGRFVVNVDAKLWSSRWPVHVRGGRFLHGAHDRSGTLGAVHAECRQIMAALGVQAVPVIAMHGAPVVGGGFVVDLIPVLPVDRLLPYLRSLAGPRDVLLAGALAREAERRLPPYGAHR